MSRRSAEKVQMIHLVAFNIKKREQIGLLSESVRSRWLCSGPDRVFTASCEVKPHLQLRENPMEKIC